MRLGHTPGSHPEHQRLPQPPIQTITTILPGARNPELSARIHIEVVGLEAGSLEVSELPSLVIERAPRF